MGYYVHLHVAFNCDRNEAVAEVAREHLQWSEGLTRESQWYLQELSQREGKNFGPKGGLLLWGLVGNATDVEQFVEELRPFWADILGERRPGLPLSHHRVVVLYEEEQTEAANAYQIGWDDPYRVDRKLEIRHFGPLPFAWNQM